MKVIIETGIPFAWAHGGTTTLVQEVDAGLRRQGIEVEFCRWWDEDQRADVYLGFGPITHRHLFAKKQGMAIVNYMFLDSFTNRNAFELFVRWAVIAAALNVSRDVVTGLGWNYARIADATIYPSQADALLGKNLFGAPLTRAHVILHGVSQAFLTAGITATHAGDYLVSVSTIHPRKNTVLLARLALASRTPIVFVGKPYEDGDPYFHEFMQLVDGKYVRYKGFVTEEQKIDLLCNARGFVLLSRQESGCIAVLEAYATGCRVLLPNRRWATPLYAGHASFCSINCFATATRQLHRFYEVEPNLPVFPVKTWDAVALEYARVLKSVLPASRAR